VDTSLNYDVPLFDNEFYVDVDPTPLLLIEVVDNRSAESAVLSVN
jgi:hypothetical protein